MLLSGAVKKKHVRFGPGESYVSSIDVAQGDSLLLLIDNVSPNGAGHFIRFRYSEMQRLSGTVIDSDSNQPIKAIRTSEQST